MACHYIYNLFHDFYDFLLSSRYFMLCIDAFFDNRSQIFNRPIAIAWSSIVKAFCNQRFHILTFIPNDCQRSHSFYPCHGCWVLWNDLPRLGFFSVSSKQKDKVRSLHAICLAYERAEWGFEYPFHKCPWKQRGTSVYWLHRFVHRFYFSFFLFFFG